MSGYLTLGPDDYLIMPRLVHVMRRQPDREGRKVWRIACGTRLSEESWGPLGYTPTVEEVAERNLAVCGNCARTKP
jgi:hypothetical protein